MKKLLFILSVLFFAFACEPEDVSKGQLDPNAMITIRPAKGVQLRSTVSGLTALEIVEQATTIHFKTHHFAGQYEEVPKIAMYGFDAAQKDYETPALKMYGYHVISTDGEYYQTFTNAFDVYIVKVDNTNKSDTLAYIPDVVINTARPLIEQAYEDENYTEVYRLFNEAFTFLPIE